jgi:hypothetical protein
MTITYDWHIANLEHEIEDGFVYTAHWTVNATEPTGETDEDGDPEVYSADAYGSVSLSRPSNLIPYESLTEEIVVSWVKEKFSEVPEAEGVLDPETGLSVPQEPKKSRLQQIEEGLAGQIESQKYPTSASGVPWAF